MPLLTELVFLCNGSARKGVPENLSYPVLSNSAARAVAFVHHTLPFHSSPFTSHSSHSSHSSHNIYSLTLSLFSLHFSLFTDSCAERSEAFRPRYIESGLQPLDVSCFTFSPHSAPTVPSLRDSVCVLIIPIRRLHRRLPICRS